MKSFLLLINLSFALTLAGENNDNTADGSGKSRKEGTDIAIEDEEIAFYLGKIYQPEEIEKRFTIYMSSYDVEENKESEGNTEIAGTANVKSLEDLTAESKKSETQRSSLFCCLCGFFRCHRK